jgi:hypothetical protein
MNPASHLRRSLTLVLGMMLPKEELGRDMRVGRFGDATCFAIRRFLAENRLEIPERLEEASAAVVSVADGAPRSGKEDRVYCFWPGPEYGATASLRVGSGPSTVICLTWDAVMDPSRIRSEKPTAAKMYASRLALPDSPISISFDEGTRFNDP